MPRESFVVATWNLWGGNAPGIYQRDRGILRGASPGSPATAELDPERTWLRRLPLLAAELARARADVVAVQESTRQGNGTCAAQLAALLDMHVVEDNDERGVALLSRVPIRSVEPLRLAGPSLGYPSPLRVEFATPIPTCVIAHLPLARVGERMSFVREFARTLAAIEPPLVVCGDLNAEPDDALVQMLLDVGLADASAGLGPTVPNPAPRVRLDYVLVANGTRDVRVRSSTRLGEIADDEGFLPSDHLGVAVELEL
jgi:endonuclease/exonuclease/phosphatase family metal-dependent hydrolase